MTLAERKILLLGSGFVAGPCVEFLVRRPENRLTIASRKIEHAKVLAAGHPRATATSCDVTNDAALEALVARHDLVISLIPYTHHPRVIKAAIKNKKHVVTTSYVSDVMASLDEEAKKAGIIVMNEIGVDPGVDHLYAVKTINEVHALGGEITSFTSYCGGLPAPECSNNPLGYKFSWSSRGVLLALRNSAKYLDDGKVNVIDGKELMDTAKPIFTGYPAYAFVGYPNRDSTPYDKRYNIPEAKTIIRGTLRYDGFPKFIKALVILGFLDDAERPDLNEGIAEELPWCKLLASIAKAKSPSDDDLTAALSKALASSFPTRESLAPILHGMKWLGMFSSMPVKRRGTLLDTLCALLEAKMQYGPTERDMVFLQHKFECYYPKTAKSETRFSTGIWYGIPNGTSAMARTVGVPCGIATQLILDEKITKTGVLAPMTPDINDPLLEALEKEGIYMTEEIL